MTNNRVYTHLTFLMLSLWLSSSCLASVLQINGIASYQELNKEYYIAALLLEKPLSSRDEIEAYKERKQMKLLVTASRWSARLWQQQWQNNIAINNSIITGDSQLQQDLEFFTAFLKGKLMKGDELVIDYTPGKGTHITLNQYPVIKTHDDKIFTYLLNTWIGKLPPSREFKSRILTLTADAASKEHIALLEGNALSEQRINTVSQWYEKPKEAALLASNAKLEQHKKKQVIAKENAYKKAIKKKAEKLKVAMLEKKKNEQKKQQLLKEKSERLKREKIADKKREDRKRAEKAARKAELKLAKLQKNKEAQLEQYYYRDLYEWQLRQAIQGQVSYPAWAKQFSQEGVVEAQFTIDRKGRAKSVTLLDEAVPKMLGSAVDKAIVKAGLKTLPPSQLKGKSWKFTVSYLFSLKGTAQKSLPVPKKPKHMLAVAGKRDNKAVAEYMSVIRNKISKALKYPSEAVLLKKRGEASIFVTVDRQGKVLKVFEKFKPKHAIFTKALSKAVDRAKPLPIMPSGVAKDSLTIDVSYSFSR